MPFRAYSIVDGLSLHAGTMCSENFSILIRQLVSFVLLVGFLLLIPIIAIFFHSGGMSGVSDVTVTSVRKQFQYAFRQLDPTVGISVVVGIVAVAATFFIIQRKGTVRHEIRCVCPEGAVIDWSVVAKVIGCGGDGFRYCCSQAHSDKTRIQKAKPKVIVKTKTST